MSESGDDQEAGGAPPVPPPPRARRARGRLLLRALVVVALAGLATAALTVAFLSTPPGRAAVRALLEAWVSSATGGTLRLGVLELAPWRGQAAAADVSLTLPEATLRAQRIELAWSPTAGTRLRITRPDLVVTTSGGPEGPQLPASGLRARPWLALERVNGVELVDGRLELRDEKGAAWLVLGRIGLETEATGRRGSLRLDEVAFGPPDGGKPRVPAAHGEASFALENGALVVASARVASGGSSVELRGRLERLQPTSAKAAVAGTIDDALVAVLAPESGVTGRIEAGAEVEVAGGHTGGTLKAASRELTIAGVGPWSATARGHLQGSQLALDSLAASGFSGRVEAEGTLALAATAPTELRVRASGLDAAALARAFGVALPLSARAGGSLRWATRGLDLETAQGQGQLELVPGAGAGLRPRAAASVRTRGRTLTIEHARLEARGAQLTADAVSVGPDRLDGRWSAELPLPSLAALPADLAGRPAAETPVEGRLLAEGTLAGSAFAPRLAAHVRGDGLRVRGRPLALDAEASYAEGRLALAPLVLRSGPGQATLSGRVPIAPAGDWDLAGEIDELGIEPALALAGLDGSGAVAGTLSVTGTRDEPAARLALRASARLRRPPASAAPAEDEVALELEAHSTGRRVELERLGAELAGGHAAGSGRYDAASGALAATLELTGLSWERLPLVPAPARRLTGTLAGRISLSGSPTRPAGELQLSLAGAAFDGAPLPSLSLAAHSDGRSLSLEGRSAAGRFAGGNAMLEGDWPLQLEIHAARLPLPAFRAEGGPGGEVPETIAASGTLALELPLRDPSRLSYHSSDLAASGRVHRLAWTLAPFTLRGDRDSVAIEGFRIAAGRASLSASGRVPLAAAGRFDLRVESELELKELDPALRGPRGLDGKASLSVTVAGTRDAPELAGPLQLTDVRGRIEGARLNDLDLAARFTGRELVIDSLTADLLGGKVKAEGRVPIAPSAGGEPARLAFELVDLDLARFLDRELREAAESPSLLVSLDGELQASALSLDALAAHGRLTRLETRSVEGGLALADAASFALESRRFTLAPLRLSGSLGELEARAEAALAGDGARGSASLTGRLDLRVLSPFLPGSTLGGPAQIDARLSRQGGSWRLDGGVKVESARLSLDTLSFALGELTGELRFEGDRVALDASASAGEGRLRASGAMRLGPALLGPADVTLDVERVPVQYPPGYRGRATGSVRLTGEAGAYRLAGALSMSQGYYTAELDAKSRSLDRLDWQLAALAGGSLTDQVALDVGVKLAEPLRVRNATLHVDVEGTVAVSGTLAQPTAGGQVTLREGGEVTLARARLRVTQGRIELNGYPAGTPQIDFEGATRVSGVALEVAARGNLDDLQLTLSSDRADLSQTDLVALLLTGRTAAAAASEGGVVVAEQLAVALGGVLQKGVGSTLLIDVSPDRSLLTDDTDPTQRFNVGTRITQNLIVIYSAALDGTEKRWIVELNPGGGRFRLRAISEENNSLSFEGTDRFAFDLWSRRPAAGKAPREIDRLVALRFEGELKLEESALRGAVKLKPGRRYSGLQREQAADRVRERLVRAGYRSASVDAVSGRVAGGVELALRVDAGPLVPIEWAGDDPGKGVRRDAELAWPTVAAPEVAAAQVARTARARLQAEGYYTASVTPAVTAGDGRVAVRLQVARGPRGTGVDVGFEGNSVLDDKALRARLPQPGSREFFEALDPRSARVANDVRLAYAGVGYLRARVGTPRAAFDAASGRLRVTIPVRERGASLVEEVELPAEARQAGDLGLKLQPGQPFDLAAYVADRDRIAAFYLENGWLEARVRGVLEARGGSVRVRYLAEPGPRPRVAEIRVEQDGRTRESLIRRSLGVHEGDRVRPAALADSRERLTEVGVFRSVDVRAVPHADDSELRDVVVGLVDKPDVQLEYGLRYTTAGEGGAAGSAPSNPTSARLQLAGAVELSNPFGYGVKTRVYGFGTTNRNTWGVTLDAATLVGRRLRTQLFVFDDSDQDIEVSGLASRVRGATLQQTRVLLRDRRSRRWHDRLRLQWGYTFKNIDYVESAENNTVLQGDRGFLSLALIGDERDNLTDPRRGVFWTATTELARTGLGSDVDYVRLYGQFFAYLPLGPFVWAQGARLGAVPGEDPLLLLENRFRAGGPTTVRGYEQNALGPQTEAGDSLGGQAVVVLNEELRFPIWKSLKGGVFWDAGNVWLTAGAIRPGDLRQSIGGGLRYMFPFGPVRVEYAWILDRQAGEPAGRFVFGLGHAF